MVPKPAALALLHYPVLDRRGEVVATSLTNLDLHDLARTAMTYGLQKLYIVTPVVEQQRLAEKIREHWCQGYGATYNPLRKEALSLIEIIDALDTTIDRWKEFAGGSILPILTGASARNGISYPVCRQHSIDYSLLLVFGTGWGLAPALFQNDWPVLEPVKGTNDYNHLPVRSAAAIIMDRLFGLETAEPGKL